MKNYTLIFWGRDMRVSLSKNIVSASNEDAISVARYLVKWEPHVTDIMCQLFVFTETSAGQSMYPLLIWENKL